MSLSERDALMPAITLWQPWASLIFSGHKRCETRSFAPPFKYVGKRIAIHAAAALPANKHFSEELCEICYDAFGCSWNFGLPRGVILGTVVIGGFYPTEKVGFIAPDERAAGDWSDGRYAWQLIDAEPLRSPVPAKGKQGWWRWDASGIETGTAKSEALSAEHESPTAGKRGRPNPIGDIPQDV